MVMNQYRTLSQCFQQYQASKTVLFWASTGCAVLATVVGFSWGGWVTGGSAQKMADEKAAQARQELAAVVCVDRFMAASDAGVQLTALKEITSSYQQAKFVAEGGWAVILPVSDPVDRAASANDRKAAALCAEDLAKRATPAAESAAQTEINDEVIVAQ
ncbi:MAG: hypothetical protein OEU92_05195 [Alphaproteobacteria bacterium]|nr:hypothetical protein [Alphaproteobacteria bacterium]